MLWLIVWLWVWPMQVFAGQERIHSETIQFTSGSATLAGTLYEPQHPFAAVVLVPGSGQQKRLAGLARLLAIDGIATLTYDKRGVGQSGGVYVGPEVGTNNVDPSNLAQLAADTNAAFGKLVAKLPSEHGPIGLLGISQAGWVIPLAAQQNTAVSFMVLFSGPLVTAREQLRFQFLTNGDERFWDTHNEAEVLRHIRHDPDRFRFVDTDPRSALATLSIPGLWLFGGRDIQVPAQLSIQRLKSLKAQGRPFEFRLFPNMGHNLLDGDPSLRLAVAIAWIRSVSAAPSHPRRPQH